MLSSLLSSIFYPIDPLYLAELMDKSDVVVYGSVVSVDDTTMDDMGSCLATIAVERELKRGLNINDTVKVLYDPYMICPAPDRYIKGRKVLAFLRKTKNAFRTVGLSYGTRYIAEDSVDPMLDRLAIYSELVDRSDKLDWVIDNVSVPLFRADAKCHLARIIEHDPSFHKKRFLGEFTSKDLSLTHIDRIKFLIISKDLPIKDFLDVYTTDDARLTMIMVDYLENMVDNKLSYQARKAMKLLQLYDEFDLVEDAVYEHMHYRCSSNDDEKLFNIARKFIANLRVVFPKDKSQQFLKTPKFRIREKNTSVMVSFGPYW